MVKFETIVKIGLMLGSIWLGASFLKSLDNRAKVMRDKKVK